MGVQQAKIISKVVNACKQLDDDDDLRLVREDTCALPSQVHGRAVYFRKRNIRGQKLLIPAVKSTESLSHNTSGMHRTWNGKTITPTCSKKSSQRVADKHTAGIKFSCKLLANRSGMTKDLSNPSHRRRM